MKKLIALLMLTSTLGLIACNTVEGAGKDIQQGGEKIQDKANDSK